MSRWPSRRPPLTARRAAAGAVAAVLLLVAGLVLGHATRGSVGSGRRGPPAARTGSPSLAVGLDVAGPGDLLPPVAVAGADPGLLRARRLVDSIDPRFVRIEVRWDLTQPSADRPLDAAAVTGDGCARGGVGPCGPPVSLDATFRALADAQRAHPGRFRPLVTFWGMPAWAGAGASGCGAARVRAGARPLAPGRDAAYRAAIARVWRAARAAGVDVADWTPWNEPNAPYFVAPQRASCAGDATPTSPATYAGLARAMSAELEALPGPQRLVLGELATWERPSARTVPADEFLRALPDRVLCRADVLSLHHYVEQAPAPGTAEPVSAALDEIGRRPCLDGRPVWITETGVGSPHGGAHRDRSASTLEGGCRRLNVQLRRWWRDRRITAAFQYSVREDPVFPVGLLDERLRRAYPAADLWRGWGGTREPAAAPPRWSCRTQPVREHG